MKKLMLILISIILYATLVQAAVTIDSPTNSIYQNSTINITYDAAVSNRNQCKIQLNDVNMSYPVCANTTLTYVHFNDSNKVLALDFAEGSGTITYGRGTVKHSFPTTEPVWNSSGRFGSALTFEGADDIQPAASTVMTVTGSPLTYIAWVYTADTTGVIMERGAATLGSQIAVSAGNAYFAYRWGASSISTITGSTINDNVWHLVIGTIDGSGNMELFVDGQSMGTNTATLMGSEPGQGFSIGSSIDKAGGTGTPSVSGYLTGSLDEIVVLNRAITPTEAELLYASASFDGSHEMKIWANDSSNIWYYDSVNFSINSTTSPPNITIISPTSTIYQNSTINITYNISDGYECKIQLNDVNMSYPVCASTTLTYVHFNDSSKVLAYDFSEGTGSYSYDKSTTQADGTITGATWNSTGKYGTALTFNGNDYINVTGNIINGNYTVMMWYYRNSDYDNNTPELLITNGQEFVIVFDYPDNAGCGTNELYVQYYEGGWQNIVCGNTSAVTTNVWHFLATTYNTDTDNMTLYIDGVEVDSATETTTYTGQTSFFIGGPKTQSIYGKGFNGSIDEFVVYNRTLSVAELTNIYEEQAFGGDHELKVWGKSLTSDWGSGSVDFTILGNECGIVTGEFNLTQNSMKSSSCLFIGADNTIINGRGYTLSGVGSGTGIENLEGYKNVKITNITITGFAMGININNSNYVNLTNVTLIDNTIDMQFNNTNLSVATSRIGSFTLRNKIKFNNSFAQIYWNSNLNANGTNFTKEINLSYNKVAINGSNPGLNKSANITLYNIPTNFGFPGILKNGVRCTSCTSQTSLNAGTVIFKVPSFSNYSINESCGNVTSSFTLTADVQAAGNCYNIKANSVTINGAGYSIFGNNSGRTFNNSAAYDSIKIANLSVSNFTTGIHMIGSANLIIEYLNITNMTQYGIYLSGDSGDNAIIRNNNIYKTLDGILVRDVDNLLIEKNFIANNSDEGIDYVNTVMQNITIINNEINNNSGNGVNIEGSPLVVSNNKIKRNTGGYGLAVNEGYGDVTYNNFTLGGGQALVIGDFNISFNRFINGSSTGLRNVGGSGTLKIFNNTVENFTSQYGIQIQTQKVKIYNNTIKQVFNQFGISVTSFSTVTHNTFIDATLAVTGLRTNATYNKFYNSTNYILVGNRNGTFANNYIYNIGNIAGRTIIFTNSNITLRNNTINASDGGSIYQLQSYHGIKITNDTILHTQPNTIILAGTSQDSTFTNLTIRNSTGTIYSGGTSYTNIINRMYVRKAGNCLSSVSNLRVNNSQFYNCSAVLRTLSGDNNLIMNTVIANSTTDMLIDGTSALNNTLINVSGSSVETVSSGNQLIKKWWYQALVRDQSSNPINGANGYIYNVSDDLETSITSAGNGLTEKISLTDYANIGGTKINYDNHTITFSKTGYNDVSVIRNITTNFVTDSITLDQKVITLSYPQNTTYLNSTIDVVSDTNFVRDECKIQLNDVNMSYPLCSNTTLTYVHFNNLSKEYAIDFAEGTGTKIYDRSKNAIIGSAHNSPTWTTNGKYGKAIIFDGTNDYINTSFGPTIYSGENFTISFWFNTTYTGSKNQSFASSIANTGTEDEYMSLGVVGAGSPCAKGTVYFQIRDTNTATLTDGLCGTSNISNGQWHLFSVVYDDTNDILTIYIDGTEESNSAITANSNGDKIFTGYPLYIGAFNYQNIIPLAYYQGSIDEFAFWNNSMTDTQIMNMYTERAYDASHNLKIWANDSAGDWYSDSVNFSIGQTLITNISLSYPQNITYVNSNVSVSYDANNQNSCKIQLNNVNMSYPLCSNTTLTYVHFNDSSKVLALDFAEGVGTRVYDRSQNQYIGEFGNNPAWNQSGKYGNAIIFDGNLDNISFGDIDTTGELTIAAWIKPNFDATTTGYDTIIDKAGGTDTGAYNLQFSDLANTFNFITITNNGRNNCIFTGATWNPGEWHFITATYNESHMTTYWDGQQKNSCTQTGTLTTTDLDLLIGSTHFAHTIGSFNGSIDELTIWNRGLTAKEIEQLYYESAYPGQHTLKVWANSSIGDWYNDISTFTINGFSCNPRDGQYWSLDLADNCTTLDRNVDVKGWEIYSTAEGSITIQNSNITYDNRTMGDFVGDSQIILAQGTVLSRS